MLMNLDLFEPRNNGANSAPGAAPTDDSMLDQIRTLDQMGYLGHHADAQASGVPAPRATAGGQPSAQEAAPEAPPEQMPQSAPSGDVEGPLP